MQAILLFLSDLIIPLFIVVILMSGFLNRRNAYADFVKGAKKAWFYTIFGRKKGLILCQLQSIIQIHFKISYCGEVARSCNKA